MSSAAPSSSASNLSGPVAICVDRPVLALDRPFTYDLQEELEAGLGSLVQVPFHGRLVRGWVLGPTDDVPDRMLKVKKAVSPVRFFDEEMLRLLRWVSERYVAPLASVIARSHPPRVASEEAAPTDASMVRPAGPAEEAMSGGWPRGGSPPTDAGSPLAAYTGGRAFLEALRGAGGGFVVRPAPEDEQAIAVEAVTAALDAGRGAIVLIPELEPLPATGAAVLEAFGDRAVLFAGGSQRARYRTWLRLAAGRHDVVVGTRPAVFAPVRSLGLLYVSRESHAGHREERSPYYHVRDVALARAAASGAACAIAALCPSAEAVATRLPEVAPPGRWWPPVEVVRPGPEGRAPRLVSALRSASRAFLYAPLPGAGIARVCRACGEPAACRACGGVLRAEAGSIHCGVCGAPGVCASCGGTRFGVAPGGAERVEEWAGRVARVPVRRIGVGDPATPPTDSGEVVVGGVEAVKDLGPLALDLVGILDADLAARRPGLAARERALASWMEAASWARPTGRIVVQTRTPNDPAVQALVAGNPARFFRSELARRREAGFPAGAPVFRVVGSSELEPELRALRPRTILVSGLGDETVCLLALDPEEVPTFARRMRTLAERGIVARVEAEPHL